jgi:hypothetical protein
MAQITSDPELAPYFVCAASPHPSINLEEMVYEGDSLGLFKSVKCPTLLMPAIGDSDEYREGLLDHSTQWHSKFRLHTIKTHCRRIVHRSSFRRLRNYRLPLYAAWFLHSWRCIKSRYFRRSHSRSNRSNVIFCQILTLQMQSNSWLWLAKSFSIRVFDEWFTLVCYPLAVRLFY